MGCIFCKIIIGHTPADVIYEDENSIAFSPKNPIAKGHTLLIPKSHVENLFDISYQELMNLSGATKKIAQRLIDINTATGMNLLHASSKDAQQSVFHFHFHLIPRYENDGLDLWIKQDL